MNTLKFGLKYFKKKIPIIVIAEILSFIGIYSELLLPLLTGMLVDFVINPGVVSESSGGMFHFLLAGRFGDPRSMKLFWSVAIVYSVLIFFRIVLIYIRNLMQERAGLYIESELRYASYHKLMELDSSTVSDYNSGELLQILNQDTIMYKELFCHRIPYFGDSIFILVMSIVLLFTINYKFIIIPIILMPFMVRTVVNFKKQARLNFKDIRKASSALNLTTQENIAAVRIVRSFTNEEFEKEKFETVNKTFLNARLKQIWLSSKFDVTLNTIKQIAYIGTIIIGAVLCIQGYLSVGFILTSASYVLKIVSQITSINNHIFNMQQQLVSGQELKNFMECKSLVCDNESVEPKSVRPNIELKNVSLTIGDHEILKNINLSIPYGKKLGITGSTGSGKSVLMKTLVRTRDITDGTITIDGHDIKDYSLKNLRSMYSYAFQDVFLFSNTIETNIAYGRPDAAHEKVAKAAVDAQANDFITGFQDGYDTIVGERGLGISGGQKQRVSLARAFLKNAPVFVLDDSTSALDVNTERRLLESLRENYSDKTVIISAHRLSSVVDCDEIIYMQDGEIIERGTFDELMALNGSFAHVYNVQEQQRKSIVDYDSLAGKEA